MIEEMWNWSKKRKGLSHVRNKDNFMMNIKSEQFGFAIFSIVSALPCGMSFMPGNVTDIEVWTDFRDAIKLVLLKFN